RVSTKEELNEIKEILCKKGIRENLLLESIELNEATISATFNSQPQPRDLKFKEDESELGFLKAAMKKVFDRAQKYSLIHFSTTHAELIEKVSAANSFEELRTVIVASVPEILPCAFEPFSPGIKFFRITSWIRFAELCQSHSQMHALLLLLFEKIRTDKLFGAIACPRCDIRFDRIDRRADISKPTIIACNLCYGYIHFKCHNEVTEIDPSPTEPSWICEVCKKIDTVEEDENEEEGKDVVENKPKSVIVGDKSLRATKAREKKDTESETTSSSRASSRNTVSQNSGWGNETTRSLRPRRQGANYSEISYVEEKVVRPKSKSSAAPEKKQVVKEEISDRYDDFCSDSRILSSLRPVKFEACENSEMTL
uniref:PHD-type domain-containing protein n=1 Tax=Panagrolaimus sp. ES5 TaxID=591445 RepID=A0AC34GCJ2_9BILA